VAEDHQTKNAQALVDQGAALLVSDAEAPLKLVDAAIHLLGDTERCRTLSTNIKKLAIWDADEVIAREILKLAGGE